MYLVFDGDGGAAKNKYLEFNLGFFLRLGFWSGTLDPINFSTAIRNKLPQRINKLNWQILKQYSESWISQSYNKRRYKTI